MTGLVEAGGDQFVPVVFDVSQVFLEAGARGTSIFADVKFGAMYDVHAVVRQAVELLGGAHLRFRPLDFRSSEDEWILSASWCITWGGSWWSGGGLS